MKVLILTGAGISAESGIPTFRGIDGLWEGHRVEDVATPTAFDADPALVQEFYNQRRRRLLAGDIQPNAAHLALAEFEASTMTSSCWSRRTSTICINVPAAEKYCRCTASYSKLAVWIPVSCLIGEKICHWRHHTRRMPHDGTLRPHVVWFGEMPIGMEQIDELPRKPICSSPLELRPSSIRQPESFRQPAPIVAKSRSIWTTRPSRSLSMNRSAARHRSKCRSSLQTLK